LKNQKTLYHCLSIPKTLGRESQI